MEYARALSTIMFDESCCLCDLTEAQVGRNQFAMDVAVDRLDGEADHAVERIGSLEDKMMDVEQGLGGLLDVRATLPQRSQCIILRLLKAS